MYTPDTKRTYLVRNNLTSSSFSASISKCSGCCRCPPYSLPTSDVLLFFTRSTLATLTLLIIIKFHFCTQSLSLCSTYLAYATQLSVLQCKLGQPKSALCPAFRLPWRRQINRYERETEPVKCYSTEQQKPLIRDVPENEREIFLNDCLAGWQIAVVVNHAKQITAYSTNNPRSKRAFMALPCSLPIITHCLFHYKRFVWVS